uniref:Uncharacterized protein n=1 Tax=Hanusia phi TaxID=3032 RepID=A0A7S0NDP5_9CRYP
MLSCLGDNRKIFLADSWEGLPKPKDTRFSLVPSQFHGGEFRKTWDMFTVEYEKWRLFWTEKHKIFPSLALNNSNVLKGLFHQTLPGLLKSHTFSYIKCDGDMYASTYDCIQFLYPKLRCGGYIYFDDYHEFPECKRAVLDYMNTTSQMDHLRFLYSVRQGKQLGIFDQPSEMARAKYEAVFWRKPC